MSESVINQATFDELKEMVGEDFIGELVETFFEEAPAQLEEMHRALDAGDAPSFRRSAHSMKSNSATFGATQLASLSRDLEYLARDGQLDQARRKMPDLEATYGQAVLALKAVL